MARRKVYSRQISVIPPIAGRARGATRVRTFQAYPADLAVDELYWHVVDCGTGLRWGHPNPIALPSLDAVYARLGVQFPGYRIKSVKIGEKG